jgi:hypothetical protein
MESFAEAEGNPSSCVLPLKPATNRSLLAVKRDDLRGFKKEFSAACNLGLWGKNKTSSIRGGTRSGGQSSWCEDHIQRLTLHQLIFFDIFV